MQFGIGISCSLVQESAAVWYRNQLQFGIGINSSGDEGTKLKVALSCTMYIYNKTCTTKSIPDEPASTRAKGIKMVASEHGCQWSLP